MRPISEDDLNKAFGLAVSENAKDEENCRPAGGVPPDAGLNVRLLKVASLSSATILIKAANRLLFRAAVKSHVGAPAEKSIFIQRGPCLQTSPPHACHRSASRWRLGC